MKVTVKSVVAAGAAFLCLAGGAAEEKILRVALPGWVELELVEVSGSSQLPVHYLYTGKEKEKLSSVSLPTYWIGRFEVMQKQYEAVMEENPSERKGDRLPVTDVRWIDAVEFCDRLNAVCRGEIPEGYRFDLPTMVEWAHAFRCGDQVPTRYAGSDDLEAVAWHGVEKADNRIDFDQIHIGGLKAPNRVGAYDMSGNVAEFMFLADAKGGNLRVGGSYRWPERFCELGCTTRVEKDARFPDLGFRVALVPEESRDPDGTSSAMGTRGRILLEAGYPTLARKYLGIALGVKDLSLDERQRIRDCWMKADLACGSDLGTWHDLMTRLSERLCGLGYKAKEPLALWDANPNEARHGELRDIVRGLYGSRGIYGMMTRVDDLPAEVVEKIGPVSARKVQAVSCDLDGDGLKDLLVELPGGTDASGDLYGFFVRRKEGRYDLVGEPVRTVGLCLIPQEKGPPVILTLIKISDEVIEPGVMDCTTLAGRTCLRIAWPLRRSFCLKELSDGTVHAKSPFMGKSNAVRRAHLADADHTRPLCWPWKKK